MNSQDILIIVVMGIFIVGGACFMISSHIESKNNDKNNDTK